MAVLFCPNCPCSLFPHTHNVSSVLRAIPILSPPAGRVSSPVQVPGTTWSELSTGGHGSSTMLCTKTDGSLWAWGSNWFGNLGQNSRIDRSSPVQVGSATDWNSVILSNSAGIAALK